MKVNTTKGSLLVLFGAFCYGMLGTLVKLAYQHGYNTAEVTISQFSIGVLGLYITNIFSQKKNKEIEKVKINKLSKVKLIGAGTSLGLTSVFYYLAVKHISVSIAIILLIQATWLSLVLEMITTKTKPGYSKIFAIIIILLGTILATNIVFNKSTFSATGLFWGILASLSYTATIYSTSRLETKVPHLKRSLFMVLGGLIIVLLIFNSSLNLNLNFPIFYSWGLSIALFGTILPPILFSKGMPLTGAGMGAIFTSLEVPVSLITAYFVLNETITLMQWLGVVIIIIAIIIINKTE
ncbi:carboxylate/amino acid/amine transporter [compost metagenome]